MTGLFQFFCGFVFLAGLVTDDAALKGRKSTVSSGRDRGERHRTRCRTPGVLVFCFLSAMADRVSRAAEPVFDIDIPAVNAAEALNRLAEQTGSVMLFSYDLARARQANAVRGRYTLLEALELLLRDTGLSGGLSEKRVVIIAEEGTMPAGKGETVKKRGLLASIVAVLAASAAPEVKADQDSEPTKLNEIVVTAQKRIERLQDVPMSITVVSDEDIAHKGLLSMDDYLRSVPSVSYLDFGNGNNQIIMRGIGLSTSEEPTVSTYLGEIPLAAAQRFANPSGTDIKLIDMQRVEVLRGPQGTLYGSGAMGGTVRNVPMAPNLKEFEGKLSVGYAAVGESDDYDGQLVGVLNLPLAKDKFAVRLAAYRFNNAGIVDLVSDPAIEAISVATGAPVAVEKDSNDSTYTGGRVALLWQPSENWKATLTQVIQELDGLGNGMALSRNGYEATSLDTGDEKLTDDFDSTNLVLEYDAGWVTLLSSSTWIDGETTDNTDLGRVTPFAAEQRTRYSKQGFAQEIRLTSKFQGALRLTGGIYYEDFDFGLVSEAAMDRGSGTHAGLLGSEPVFVTSRRPTQVEQKAVFGELGYAVNDAWDLLLGGRWFDYDRRDVVESAFAGFPTESDLRADESDST